MPDQVINTGTDGTVSTPTKCSGETRSQGCDVILSDYECPSGNGGKIKETGKVTWAADGSKGSGTVQYVLTLGTGETCTETYFVTYKRQ